MYISGALHAAYSADAALVSLEWLLFFVCLLPAATACVRADALGLCVAHLDQQMCLPVIM
jgi:hypothetical protein